MRTTLGGVIAWFLVALLAGAPVRAQLADAPLAGVIVRSMSLALGRIGAAPVALLPEEHVELKRLVKHGRAAIAVLGWQIADSTLPADYLRDLMTANLELGRILAKSSVTRDDLAKLGLVVKDIQAKQTWAENNPDAPFGPVVVEPVVGGGAATAAGTEVWWRRLLDDGRGEVVPIGLEGGATTLAIRPGSYAFWLRTRGKTPEEGVKTEFCADGATTRIELTMR